MLLRGADPRWHIAARTDTPHAVISGGREWLSGAEKRRGAVCGGAEEGNGAVRRVRHGSRL